MDKSARFGFDYLLPNQAQKHVTMNEALRRLDIVTGLALTSRSVTVQPAAPAEGETYLLGEAATGAAWDGFEAGRLAAFVDGAWMEIAPPEGLTAWLKDEGAFIVREADGWQAVSSGSALQLGVNTEADEVNRLAVKSDAVLFSHDDVTPGSGDMRLALNRAGTGDVASLLFQTGFDGDAEMGLLGSGDFAIRTSPDGESFTTAIAVNRTDGRVAFPAGFSDPAGLLSALAFRRPLGTIDDDEIAVLDFGEPVYGTIILAIPNALSSAPAVFFFARLAPSPGLSSLFSGGAAFTMGTTPLTGTSGEDGKINFSVSDAGVFTIENRRGFAITYTLYVFQR